MVSKSIRTMVEELDEMHKIGNTRLTDWEDEFIPSIVGQVKARNGDTTRLTIMQVECIEKLHRKYC